MKRCSWPGKDELMLAYHDREWGVPARDEKLLFEFLTLEGAQAGLSWSTILKKREGYRKLFAGFDAAKVARFSAARIEKLLLDPAIVRNRLKVESTVNNAKAIMALRKSEEPFPDLVWSFVGGRPLHNRWRELREIPPETPESKAMSKALKQKGFRFVGPTVCYAFMQAAGLVNDHVTGCYRHRELRRG